MVKHTPITQVTHDNPQMQWVNVDVMLLCCLNSGNRAWVCKDSDAQHSVGKY